MTPMLLGLLMAAQVPADLMARADEAAGTYVQCLFATVRESNQAGLSVAQFERRLGAACLAEEQRHRALAIRIFRLRGDPAPIRKAEQLDAETRRGMVDDYRKLPEMERKLKDLAELCRAQPDACKQD